MPRDLISLARTLHFALWALFLLTQQEAFSQNPKAGEVIVQPPIYSSFTFPTQAPVAKIMFAIAAPGSTGKTMAKRERVLAQGRVRLPINSDLFVDLCFDSLAHLDSLKQLYPCRVSSLSAANLDFEDKDMHFLEGFKSLTGINMSDTLISDKSLAQIAMFPKLNVIRLSKTNVTGTGFDQLKRLHNLFDISLEGINLKPGTIGELKPLLPNLIGFNVTRTGLTKEDATVLKELKVVRELRLATNRQIDNQCVKYLSQLKELESLSIADTSITDKSIPMLIKIPKLKSVKVRDKDFWTSTKHQTKYGRLEFIDAERTSTIPADFCITGK